MTEKLKTKQSRRSFLKSATWVAGMVQLPLIGWSAGFSTMFSGSLSASGEFSLLKLNKLLAGYPFPFTEQFLTDDFRLNFQLYNLYGERAVRAGRASLQSAVGVKEQKFIFTVDRLANDGIRDKNKTCQYIVSGKVICRQDDTLSPVNWNMTSKIAFPDSGASFGGTELNSDGEVRDGQVYIHTNGKTTKKRLVHLPLSWKWGLIAVVQNMAKTQVKELQFSTLDEFDALYSNQKMRFRRTVSLDCGKDRVIGFKVFELTGDGVIPTVYWVDNLNRTVFVISGMEAWVLEGKD